ASGSIINTASTSARLAGWSGTAYSAAKAAVVQLSRCAAIELGRHSIRVNSVSPGQSVGEPPPSDAELATRALAGDAEALAALLERYRPSLYAAAIGLLRNREEAHDAVQEACVVALVRIGSLRDPAAVGGWLHRIIRNVCLMRLR